MKFVTPRAVKPSDPQTLRPLGFTLLEILLAVALTAIVAGILATSLYTAFQAKNSVDSALEATRATDTAADMLEQELSLALAPTPAPAGSNTAAFLLPGAVTNTNLSLLGPFEGDAGSLDFFASGSEPKSTLPGGGPDVREIQYLLVPDPAGTPAGFATSPQLLVRRVVTNLLEDQYIQPPDEVVARNVIQFTLSYTDGASWYDTWDSTQQNDQLPVAVQFTLELAPIPPSQKTRLDSRTLLLPCTTQSSSSTTSGLGGALP